MVVCGICFAEPDTILVFKIFYEENLRVGLVVIEAWFRGY